MFGRNFNDINDSDRIVDSDSEGSVYCNERNNYNELDYQPGEIPKYNDQHRQMSPARKNLPTIFEESSGSEEEYIEKSTIPSVEEEVDCLEREARYQVWQNEKLRQMVKEKEEEEKSDLKDGDIEKLSLQLTFLKREVEYLSQQKLNLHLSIATKRNEVNKTLDTLNNDNQLLKMQVSKLRQRIRKLDRRTSRWAQQTTGETGCTAGCDEGTGGKYGYGKPAASTIESCPTGTRGEKSREVTAGPDHSEETTNSPYGGLCSVRITSHDRSVKKKHILEYARQFEGVVDIEFMSDQHTTLYFSHLEHAREFSTKQFCEVNGVVLEVGLPINSSVKS